MEGVEAGASAPSGRPQPRLDPVLRNVIRYTISAKEYRTLHEYLIKQTPHALRDRTLDPAQYAAAIKSKDDYNAAAIRASLRVFLAAQTSLKLYDIIVTKFLRRNHQPPWVSTSAILRNALCTDIWPEPRPRALF